MLSGERTRMTWTLSFGEARGAPLARRQGFSPFGWFSRLVERARGGRPREVDWSSAAAIAFGVVTFAWGIAILLSR